MGGSPVKAVRIFATSLAFAWAVITMGAMANAVVKSFQEQNHVKSLAPAGAIVKFSIGDVLATGAVVGASSIIMLIATAVYMFIIICEPKIRTSANAITIEAVIFTLCTVLLCAGLIPYTHFVRTRTVVVHVTIRGIEVPDSLVSLLQGALGVSSFYRDRSYLRLVAIFGWLSALFSLIACIILYLDAAEARRRGVVTKNIAVSPATTPPASTLAPAPVTVVEKPEPTAAYSSENAPENAPENSPEIAKPPAPIA